MEKVYNIIIKTLRLHIDPSYCITFEMPECVVVPREIEGDAT